MNLISFVFISYSKRIIRLTSNWGTFMLVVFIPFSFVYVSNYVGFFLILFFVYYLIKILQEARLYIVEINEFKDDLELQYYWLNKGPKKINIPLKSLKVDWFDSVKGNISAPRILIKGKDVKLSQYAVGEWDKNSLKQIYEKINYYIYDAQGTVL